MQPAPPKPKEVKLVVHCPKLAADMTTYINTYWPDHIKWISEPATTTEI